MHSVSPIVRTFFQLRNELVDVLGVDRRDVRPSTRLDELIPPARRRQVWKRLRERGLYLPELRMRPVSESVAVYTAMAAAILLLMLVQWWLALLGIIHTVHAIWKGTRPFAVHLGCGPITLRDAAVYTTRFKHHPGHRWSQQEIALKVRLIVSDCLGVPLDEVQPETRFIDPAC